MNFNDEMAARMGEKNMQEGVKYSRTFFYAHPKIIRSVKKIGVPVFIAIILIFTGYTMLSFKNSQEAYCETCVQ